MNKNQKIQKRRNRRLAKASGYRRMELSDGRVGHHGNDYSVPKWHVGKKLRPRIAASQINQALAKWLETTAKETDMAIDAAKQLIKLYEGKA